MGSNKEDLAEATRDPQGENAFSKKETSRSLMMKMTGVFLLVLLLLLILWAFSGYFMGPTPAGRP